MKLRFTWLSWESSPFVQLAFLMEVPPVSQQVRRHHLRAKPRRLVTGGRDDGLPVWPENPFAFLGQSVTQKPRVDQAVRNAQIFFTQTVTGLGVPSITVSIFLSGRPGF